MPEKKVIEKYAHEKKCDSVLTSLNDLLFRENGLTKAEIIKKHPYINDVSAKGLDTVFAILKHEQFIYSNKEWYYITDKGIHFAETDSFEERAKRWELDKKIKHQEYKLGVVELWAKRKTFWIALSGLILAALTLFLQLKEYYDKSNNP